MAENLRMDVIHIKKEEIEQIIGEYEKQVGLLEAKKVEAPKCLDATFQELKKYNPEQLIECHYEVNQYLSYIQSIIAKEKAWLRFAESKLDELQASYLPDVGDAYGWNGKMLIARHNPPLCKRMNQFIHEIKMKLDRMYQTPDNIKAWLEIIKDLKFEAIRRMKEYATN